MKRALAERAKQSGHPNGLSPPSVSSGLQPPLKVLKSEPKPEADSLPTMSNLLLNSRSGDALVASPGSDHKGSSGSTRGKVSMKRQRSALAVDVEDEEEASTNAFYLKHQNSALASELKQIQCQFRLLEKEREYRRRLCQEANKVLHSLESTWTQMEVALQLGQQPPTEPRDSGPLFAETPRSTGSGESVELIGALLDSLAALGKDVQSDGLENLDEEQKRLHRMNRVAQGVAQRALTLQRWIWALLGKITMGAEDKKQQVFNLAELHGRIALLSSQCQEYQARINELAKSRDDAAASEKRVRRGLYRLASGRTKLPEVLRAVESDDIHASSELLSLDEAVTTKSEVLPEGGDESNEGEGTDLRKKIQDLEGIASARQEHIEKLAKDCEDLSKRVNELSLPVPKVKKEEEGNVPDDVIKRSALYTETWTKMLTAQRQLAELQEDANKTKNKLACARGDVELVSKNLEDQANKHKKRWAELVGADVESDDQDTPRADELAEQSRKITELEHKLTQALENVRQADVVRANLEEATRMNETLQTKLEEFKAKNATLLAGKSSSRGSSDSGKEKNASSGTQSADGKVEKLHREHRRMRKELSAAIASKESAKAKQERAEKERDSLVKSNARLLKQSSEKDDINAKSLSTILHLKELTEQLRQERDLLEQQVKGSGQLNLATRLVSNARERLVEEAFKDRQSLEEKIKSLEDERETLKREKEIALGDLSQKEADMASFREEAISARRRCDELVAASSRHVEEKQQLMESLAIAQRETGEAARKIAKLQSRDGGSVTSEFTTEQLTTQISVLKGRLTCPVCNHRDKKCILLRCRHMFCKQCVEENVRNRSRKCPACGQRFDNKDVEDIWL